VGPSPLQYSLIDSSRIQVALICGVQRAVTIALSVLDSLKVF